MHKHANRTCACAVDPDARSQLQLPADAAAPGRAFPASRQALQAPQRHRGQYTDRDKTNTPDKEDKARAQGRAPRCYELRASCELAPAEHSMSYTQLALQRCGWDARANGPEGGAPCCQCACRQEQV